MDPQPDPTPAPPMPMCSFHPEVPSVRACALCSRPICTPCVSRANNAIVCPDCKAKIQAELAAQSPDATTYPRAIVGGAIGALIGGAAWAAIAVATNAEIGYVAIGVGFLAGYGVLLASGQKKSQPLQVIAVGCSLLGLLLGKYFIVAHYVVSHFKGKEGVEMGYFDPKLIKAFGDVLPKMLGPFDILWIVLAFATAWKMVAPTNLRMR